MSLSIRYLIISFCTILLTSCGSEKRELVWARDNVDITPERAEQFARKIEAALNEGNTALVDQWFDIDALFDRMADGRTATKTERENFRNSVAVRMGMMTRVMQDIEMGENASVRLLRIRWNDGQPRGLYRIIGAAVDVYYVELIFGSRNDTVITIDDIFMYATGELLSASMRRLEVGDQGGFLDAAMLPDEQEEFAAVRTMMELIRSGQSAKALQHYMTLPERLKKEKFIQLLRLNAAMEVSEMEAYATISYLQARFPNDASVNLFMIGHYLRNQKFDSMMVPLDRLDSILGGDPYLGIYRSFAAHQQKNYDLERSHLEKVIAHDSTLLVPHDLMIAALVGQGDYAAAVRTLDLLAERFAHRIDPASIEGEEDARKFVQSNEYREWRERQQN